MDSFGGALPYFSESELACKGTGIIRLDRRFAVELPYLRHEWGEPLTLTSVCRSPEHNKQVGGHPHSLHLTENPYHSTNGTMACDVAWGHWTHDKQREFALLAWGLGWSVGLNNSFCHIDRRGDTGLARKVFEYGGWSLWKAGVIR